MLRYNRLFVFVAVCVVAGPVFAKAGKIKVMTAAGAGLVANPGVDGHVVMNYHDAHGQSGAATEIQLHVKDLEANTTYGVQVTPGVSERFAFTTNPSGNAHWQGQVTFDITTLNPVVRIFIDDGSTNPFDWTFISYNELRAIGCLDEVCTVGDPCTTAADCDDSFLCTVDTCDGGYCFHAPYVCPGATEVCQLTSFNCVTGCIEYCSTGSEEGCCNEFGPCPGPDPPGICPCPGGICGCAAAPCP